MEIGKSGKKVLITMDMERARDGQMRLLAAIDSPEGKQEIETIMSDLDVYIREPEQRWVRMSTEQNQELGQAFQTANLGFFDIFPAGEVPWDLYTVETLGREDVDGVPTEHLSVQADFQELWNRIGEERRRNLTQALAGPAGGFGHSNEPFDQVEVKRVDIWIDDQGYARRTLMEMELGELGIKMDIRAFDFNQDILVELPQDFEEFPSAFLEAPARCPPTPDLVSHTPSDISPALPPSEQSNPEEMLRRTIAAMYSLSSYLIEVTFEATEPGIIEFKASGQGARSGESAYMRVGTEAADSGFGFGSETVIVPPYRYTIDPRDCKWYRSRLEETPPPEDVQILEFFRFVFPHPDVPPGLYELTPVGVETVNGVQTTHTGINVDWHGIADWLEAEGKLAEVAAQLSPGESPEEFKRSYVEDPPGSLKLWIDGHGFVRQMVISDTENTSEFTMRLKAPNEQISIQPPMDFEEGPTPSLSFAELEGVPTPPPEALPITREAIPSLSVRGTVIALGDAAKVTAIKFKLVADDRAGPIGLRDASTLIAYATRTARERVAWSATWVVGEGEDLNPGEVAEIAVDISGLATPLGPDTTFQILVVSGQSAQLTIERTTPAQLTAVMDLR